MTQPFHQSSYLSQVRQLRKLAEDAISLFPVKVDSIHFIHHGENATFRIDTRDGGRFLLRLHRNDYHTASAIEEELAWLELLAQTKELIVPQPLTSKEGRLVESVFNSETRLGRRCSVFRWIDGRFVGKTLRLKHMSSLGELIAKIQTYPPRPKTRERRYWTADGLVGRAPKFGPTDQLCGVSRSSQKIITETRSIVHKQIKAFEAAWPSRQGMIHADLHFGNILSVNDKLGAIDFDDCGHGFFVYDLVVPLISTQLILGPRRTRDYEILKTALVNSYARHKSWNSVDETILPHFMNARRLAMLGWLNSRSDNPRLRKYLKGAVKRAVKNFRKDYHV